MKVAEARFTGRGRTHHRKLPSGGSVQFKRYPGHPDRDELEGTDIEDPDDAKFLEAQPNIEVDWTPKGRLKAAGDDAVSAMKEMGYQAKQKLVGDDGFGLDGVAGNDSEDDMEAALADHIKQLEKNGEL